MKSIPDDAEEHNRVPTAKRSDVTAPAESALPINQGVSDGCGANNTPTLDELIEFLNDGKRLTLGERRRRNEAIQMMSGSQRREVWEKADAARDTEKQRRKHEEKPIRYFSRELAVKINPVRPDYTASMILFGLFLLQQMFIPPFSYVPMVNGNRGCYASLSELVIKYPWLTEEAIRLALKRAAKAFPKDFIVDRDNPGAERGKLHFWLSPKLIKEYRFAVEKHRGLFQVNIHDVVAYGFLEAVLISNLEYITEESRNRDPLVDDDGNIFREVSPTLLTKPRENKGGVVKPIIPSSRKAVSDALNHLKTLGKFREHPTREGFFMVERTPMEHKVGVTKVAGAVTKVASRVTKVARQTLVLSSNSCGVNDLQPISETSYTNAYTNPDTKCLIQPTLPPSGNVACNDSCFSSGAKKLNDCITDALSAFRQNRMMTHLSKHPLQHHAVYQIQDYDKFSHVGYELIYEDILLDNNTGEIYSRNAEIDYIIKQLEFDFRIDNFEYKKAELQTLRQLFVNNPLLTYDHIRELLISGYFRFNGCRYPPAPKKGHDEDYFGRKITNLKTFLHYLPQLVRERYVRTLTDEWEYHPESGKPMFDYSGMEEPFLSMAFAGDTTTPVTYEEIDKERQEIDKDSAYYYYLQHDHPWVKTAKPTYKTVYYTEYRPIYYAEFIGEPTKEYVEHERNPIETQATEAR